MFSTKGSVMRYAKAGYLISRSAATEASLKSVREMPGPLLAPFLGSTWMYLPVIGKYDMMHLDKAAEDYNVKYGDYVYEKFGKIQVVHLFDPKHFEVVAKATMDKPIRLGFISMGRYRETNPDKYKSPGILPLNDERWWKLRQAFQKTVSPLKEARDFLNDTDDITKDFVDNLESGQTIKDFMFMANRLNMELVCKLLFDVKVDCLSKTALEPNSKISQFVDDAVELAEGIGEQDRNEMAFTFLRGASYKKMMKTVLVMEQFALDMIEKVRTRGDLDENRCILARFIKDPNIDDKELLAITIDLLIGGIHTTAITSCFMLHHVNRNPQVESKIVEEAKRLLPPGARITNDTLNQAVYTRAVMKETFRLTPIATAQGRTLTEDLAVGQYTIPKDTLVILQSLVACKKEEHFKDALKFKPERWVKGSPEYEQVNPYLVLPFGLGLRACIARRRAEQNLLVLALRVYSSGKMVWQREDELGFKTPFMITPDGPVTFKYVKH